MFADRHLKFLALTFNVAKGAFGTLSHVCPTPQFDGKWAFTSLVGIHCSLAFTIEVPSGRRVPAGLGADVLVLCHTAAPQVSGPGVRGGVVRWVRPWRYDRSARATTRTGADSGERRTGRGLFPDRSGLRAASRAAAGRDPSLGFRARRRKQHLSFRRGQGAGGRVASAAATGSGTGTRARAGRRGVADPGWPVARPGGRVEGSDQDPAVRTLEWLSRNARLTGVSS
jgi:hypothetical protein